MANKNMKEALSLSENILAEIELSSAPLNNLALKTARLARLMTDFEVQQIMMYEASGYPNTSNGVTKEVWDLCRKAGRLYEEKDEKSGEVKEYATLFSIEQLEMDIETYRDGLKSAQDSNISVSSANPLQYVSAPIGNAKERSRLLNGVSKKTKIISERRAFIYNYVLSVYYELKFSQVAGDIFGRIRNRVDSKVGEIIPDSIKKFAAVYDNLESENDEDWSNAVHSCRRILQDTADSLYEAREDKIVDIGGKPKTIKLGTDNYINRLIAYVEENSNSERFDAIVGSHIKYLGERLDAIFQAAQKGSHNVISTQDEADRYVIYTYLVVGDLLHLKGQVEVSPERPQV